MKSNKAILAVVFLFAALNLSACGKKGPLELPKSTNSAEETTGEKDAQASQAEAEVKKPQRSFILDPLLQ